MLIVAHLIPDGHWTLDIDFFKNSSSEKVIALLENLPLEQVIVLKSYVDLVVNRRKDLPSLLSDDELSFISNLYQND